MVVFRVIVLDVVVVVVKRLENRAGCVDAIVTIFELLDGVEARESLTGLSRSKISFSTPASISSISLQ